MAGSDNFSEIARQLGVSHTTISRDVAVIEEQWREEAAQDIAVARGRDLKRTERLISAHWKGALKGIVQDTDRVIALMNHRAKLLGMAPKGATSINVSLDVTFSQVLDRIAEEDGLTDVERRELEADVREYLAAKS